MNVVLLLAIVVAAFFGGAARFLISKALPAYVGTWAANTLSTCILVLILVLVLRGDAPAQSTEVIALSVGFCGALSTWSTFAKELSALRRTQNWRAALTYALATFIPSVFILCGAQLLV